jgi:hypothetical protein
VAAALVRREFRGRISDSDLPSFRIQYSSVGVPLTAMAHNPPRPNPHLLEPAHD